MAVSPSSAAVPLPVPAVPAAVSAVAVLPLAVAAGALVQAWAVLLLVRSGLPALPGLLVRRLLMPQKLRLLCPHLHPVPLHHHRPMPRMHLLHVRQQSRRRSALRSVPRLAF